LASKDDYYRLWVVCANLLSLEEAYPGNIMSSITDDYMREVVKSRKPYTLVVFRSGAKANEPGADKTI